MTERPADFKLRLGIAVVALIAMFTGVIMKAIAGQTVGAIIGFVITIGCALWIARLYFRR
ncbi:MAG: hypothetical protein PGN15_15715 [Aeromicrobium erythreum]